MYSVCRWKLSKPLVIPYPTLFSKKAYIILLLLSTTKTKSKQNPFSLFTLTNIRIQLKKGRFLPWLVSEGLVWVWYYIHHGNKTWKGLKRCFFTWFLTSDIIIQKANKIELTQIQAIHKNMNQWDLILRLLHPFITYTYLALFGLNQPSLATKAKFK